MGEPISKWEPLGDIERFFEGRPYISLFPKLGWDLAVDMYEKSGSVIAKMSLPGVNPEELDITVDEDTLTIAGSREEEKEVEKKNYYAREIRRGEFSRTVSLPRTVDASRVSADYADGILTVSMPEAAGEEARGVKVNVAKR